jgi:hypothetical protein
LALANYKAVVDSFPRTSYAPLAAYAIGWIYKVEKGDTASAVGAFSELIREYPVSPQARGAVYEIGLLGEEALKNQLEAYIDSAVTDTMRISAEKERIRAEAAGLAAASVDSSATLPAGGGSLGDAGAGTGSIAGDSLATEPVLSDSAVVDSAGAGGTAAADSSRVPSGEQIRRDTKYPLGGAADTSGTPKPPRTPAESPVQRADSSSSARPERR